MAAITEDAIRELAAFRGREAPVTTCYLDVDGRRFIRHQDYQHELELLLRSGREQANGSASVADDFRRIEDYVKRRLRPVEHPGPRLLLVLGARPLGGRPGAGAGAQLDRRQLGAGGRSARAAGPGLRADRACSSPTASGPACSSSSSASSSSAPSCSTSCRATTTSGATATRATPASATTSTSWPTSTCAMPPRWPSASSRTRASRTSPSARPTPSPTSSRAACTRTCASASAGASASPVGSALEDVRAGGHRPRDRGRARSARRRSSPGCATRSAPASEAVAGLDAVLAGARTSAGSSTSCVSDGFAEAGWRCGTCDSLAAIGPSCPALLERDAARRRRRRGRGRGRAEPGDPGLDLRRQRRPRRARPRRRPAALLTRRGAPPAIGGTARPTMGRPDLGAPEPASPASTSAAPRSWRGSPIRAPARRAGDGARRHAARRRPHRRRPSSMPSTTSTGLAERGGRWPPSASARPASSSRDGVVRTAPEPAGVVDLDLRRRAPGA